MTSTTNPTTATRFHSAVLAMPPVFPDVVVPDKPTGATESDLARWKIACECAVDAREEAIESLVLDWRDYLSCIRETWTIPANGDLTPREYRQMLTEMGWSAAAGDPAVAIVEIDGAQTPVWTLAAKFRIRPADGSAHVRLSGYTKVAIEQIGDNLGSAIAASLL